jgi:hypothetical protein
MENALFRHYLHHLQEGIDIGKRAGQARRETTDACNDSCEARLRPSMEVSMLNRIFSGNDSRPASYQQTHIDGIAGELGQPGFMGAEQAAEAPSVADRRNRSLLSRWIARESATLPPFVARFAVINLVGLAMIAAAWAEGLLFKPYQADSSGMCYLITILFLAGLVAVFRKDWQTVRWAGNALVYLGMVGTVLGLIITVSDLTVDKAQNFDNFKTIVSSIYIGSGTALYTNLLACIGYLWLGTNAHLLARQEV